MLNFMLILTLIVLNVFFATVAFNTDIKEILNYILNEVLLLNILVEYAILIVETFNIVYALVAVLICM